MVTGAAVVGATLIPTGPALSASPKLPDLIAYPGSFDHHYVDTIRGRKLLRFAAGILNVGDGAMEIRGRRANARQTMQGFQAIFQRTGAARETPIGPLTFVPSEQSWHVMFLASYTLLDDDGHEVTDVNKFSSCISDDSKVRGNLPGSPRRSVYTQCPGGRNDNNFKVGLSIGYADVYPATRLNQSLDITNLPPGNYTFHMEADPDDTILEKNEGNNTLDKTITL